MNNKAIIKLARERFHACLVRNGVLSVDKAGVPSNSDSGNRPSCAIGALMAKMIGAKISRKLPAQTAGTLFEEAVCEFIENTFPRLKHLRPGKWNVFSLGNNNAVKTSSFAQYEHLSYLLKLANANRQLATMLGNDYMVAPDIVVSRDLCEDREINASACFVDGSVGLRADIRKSNGGLPIMHASVSAKWTMRSDRAQNSRTEALGLIRNRKGHLPHIVVVTGEPLPSRLASLATGTGDIDCVYHFALYELIEAVAKYGKSGREDLIEQLNALVDGKRLKDISDLPLDLTC